MVAWLADLVFRQVQEENQRDLEAVRERARQLDQLEEAGECRRDRAVEEKIVEEWLERRRARRARLLEERFCDWCELWGSNRFGNPSIQFRDDESGGYLYRAVVYPNNQGSWTVRTQDGRGRVRRRRCPNEIEARRRAFDVLITQEV
jgi:hypothetical protein